MIDFLKEKLAELQNVDIGQLAARLWCNFAEHRWQYISQEEQEIYKAMYRCSRCEAKLNANDACVQAVIHDWKYCAKSPHWRCGKCNKSQ